MLWQHELPTHLGVQDRVLGPFTMRQVLILLSGASVAYEASMLLRTLPLTIRIGVTAVAIALTLALALLRPGGRGIEVWAAVIARYALLPKRSVWRPRSPATDGKDAQAGWAGHAPSLAWPVNTRAAAGRAVWTEAAAL
jgi:hypothetical protein